jgi:UDP-N-acetylglucosamine--N-acetylmuramyl-(pentapeptide) pyrophosphoryl-undecaprenol N-acetylglucosamine transferase
MKVTNVMYAATSIKRIIMSGGGTGGHIFPAIAVANALKEAVPEAEILFVGAEGRMEMEKVPAAGYEIVGLPVAGLVRGLSTKNLLLPFKLMKSFRKASALVREFRPDVVAGTGGYASLPVLRAAQRAGIPTLIQEQNSFAGLANKYLGRRACAICVAYEGMERFFPADRIMLAGNPVRGDLLSVAASRNEAFEFFGLDPSRPVLLSLGGSLGAETINRSMEAGLALFARRGIQLVWQTGRGFRNVAMNAAANSQGVVRVFDFIARMDLAYAAADAIVSRAGAGTISELCIVGKPAVLVPSPNVAEDHQSKNAGALKHRGAALVVADADARSKLADVAAELFTDTAASASLSHNISRLAMPDAARNIAAKILSLK